MPRNDNSIDSVIARAIILLTEKKVYSKRSAEYIVRTWNQFQKYCVTNNYFDYSSEAKDAFVQYLSTITPPLKPSTIDRKNNHMQILNLIANNKKWDKGDLYPKPELPDRLTFFINEQEILLKKRNYSDFSCKTINKQTTYLFRFFMSMGITDLSQIEQKHIKSYIMSISGHARSTLRCELSRLRQVFHNAYSLEFTEIDMSCYVPTFNLGIAQSKVKIWNSKEIKKLLDTVDRASLTGLRDAAFITIASELGMRNRDILNLKLSDFDWEQCSVTFVQSKTGRVNTLPINEKTGNAIIDYLRVRPDTEHEYLFVSLNPPYDQVKSFSSEFDRYVQRSGVSIPTNAHHNLHSLRATVATRLLEEGVSPDDIFSFLGHSDRESLHHYIRMDIEHLRECALSFEDGEFI